MIETGIIRKIDGMGRLVIPKELRQKLNIKENDYLEFSLTSTGLLIYKHSKLNKLQELAQELTDTLNLFLACEVFIADKDSILAYTGLNKEKYLNKNISRYLTKAINRRESLYEIYNKDLEIIEGDSVFCSYIDETIVSNSEEAGILVLYRTDRSVDEIDLKIVNIVTSFLTKYLDE